MLNSPKVHLLMLFRRGILPPFLNLDPVSWKSDQCWSVCLSSSSGSSWQKCKLYAINVIWFWKRLTCVWGSGETNISIKACQYGSKIPEFRQSWNFERRKKYVLEVKWLSVSTLLFMSCTSHKGKKSFRLLVAEMYNHCQPVLCLFCTGVNGLAI